MDQQEVLANLVAITGVDEAQALNLLEATEWKLEDAVSLCFATNDGHNGGAQGGSGGASHQGGQYVGEDEVRAPLPTKMDRLYGNTTDPRHHLAAASAQYGLNQPRQQPPVDVFRDFKVEGEEAQGKASSAGLSQLFKPPQDLLFLGDFQMAKMRASQEEKWILLNIQAHDNFDSHRLNRDTWNLDSLKEMIKGMFLFCQFDESSHDGQKLCTMYKVERVPCILVLDPVTGAKLYSKSGFVGAEKLIEDLVPFMDHGPTDPGAGQMAYSMGLKRKAQEEAALAAAAAASQAGQGSTEDEQMALAIAMSMQEASGSGGPSQQQQAGPSSSSQQQQQQQQQQQELDDIDEEAVWEQIRQQERQHKEQQLSKSKTPEQVQQEAAARLPSEPPDSDPSGCRVAFRLPDGSRQQRRFSRQDTVQALLDFCLCHVKEAAGGTPFDLVPALPGAQALQEPGQSLEAAGVANAMLAVKLK